MTVSLLDLPPGPRQPRYAQALQWIARPRAFAERCRERFGDVFTIDFDGEGLVFLAGPEDVRTVFTGSAELMHAGEANAPLEPVVGPRSILLLDERPHLRERRLLLPPFHGERMRRYEGIMREAARREVATWRPGRTLALHPRMQGITLEVIMRAVFGVEEGARMERLAALLRRMLELTTNTGLLFLTGLLGERAGFAGRLRAALGPVDDELHRLIAEHREDPRLPEREDILSMLLLARDEDGAPMSDGELRDELMTLLLAGHETTATTLAWAFERLVQHPRALARAAAEARSPVAETPYLDAVVTETLRLRPVIPLVVRKITAPISVGGGRFHLPAGTRVAPAILLVHAREDLYPDADAFRPERWLGEEGATRAPGAYTWIPFGGGLRRCVGAAFAQFEMRQVLRVVLSSVELEAPGGPERTGRRGFTLVPREGARVRVRRRLPAGVPREREPQLAAA